MENNPSTQNKVEVKHALNIMKYELIILLNNFLAYEPAKAKTIIEEVSKTQDWKPFQEYIAENVDSVNQQVDDLKELTQELKFLCEKSMFGEYFKDAEAFADNMIKLFDIKSNSTSVTS